MGTSGAHDRESCLEPPRTVEIATPGQLAHSLHQPRSAIAEHKTRPPGRLNPGEYLSNFSSTAPVILGAAPRGGVCTNVGRRGVFSCSDRPLQDEEAEFRAGCQCSSKVQQPQRPVPTASDLHWPAVLRQRPCCPSMVKRKSSAGHVAPGRAGRGPRRSRSRAPPLAASRGGRYLRVSRGERGLARRGPGPGCR
jgi:hypothetical protein